MLANMIAVRTICELADKHKALVFIDECHATGFFGTTGRYVLPVMCGRYVLLVMCVQGLDSLGLEGMFYQ